MTSYLPAAYVGFRETYPDVAEALDALAAACDSAGPLDPLTTRFAKLGIAVGAMAEGAVRSNVRKALDLGATESQVRHVGLMALTTAGFPAAVAVLGWIDEVLAAR